MKKTGKNARGCGRVRAEIDGRIVEFDKGTPWKALVRQPGALGVSVGGSTLSLNAPARDGAQAHALTYADEEGRHIYEHALSQSVSRRGAEGHPRAAGAL